jgi:transposase
MDTPRNICQLVINKLNAGFTQGVVAEQLEITQSAVKRICQRYKRTGSIDALRKGRCGRKSKISPHCARLLSRESLRNPKATARQVQAAVGDSANTVSVRTIQRSLIRSGLQTFRPVKSPSWTPAQMTARLEWAKKCRRWSVEKWKKVRRKLLHN